MTENEKSEWIDFKKDLKTQLTDMMKMVQETHDSFIVLTEKVVGIDEIHRIAEGKVKRCKEHQKELKEAVEKSSKQGSGFFSSLSGAQRTTMISLVCGILLTIMGWLEERYTNSHQRTDEIEELVKTTVKELSKGEQ